MEKDASIYKALYLFCHKVFTAGKKFVKICTANLL